MRDTYGRRGWKESQFIQLNRHDFEEYYPDYFASKFNEIKMQSAGIDNKDSRISYKRKMKKKLLDEVIEWSFENKDTAKKEFEKSASEIIDILRQIERELNK